MYNEIDGLRFIMEQKELERRNGEFPTHVPNGAESYTKIFFEIERMMNSQVHSNVVLGAAGLGDGILNDHGVDHVAMVAERAFMLLGKKADELCGFEIFFLLLVIHFHDVGNVLGREEHEEKIDKVFDALGDRFPLDNTAQRLIRDIAMSHGGNIDGDKDTLFHVEQEVYIDGIKIRASLLAAILRYADEIADDKNRALAFLNKVGAIPAKNRAFHEYSLALEPPVIEGDTLKMNYNIANKFIENKISKNDTEVYLYDEILSRLQKCLCELDYCRKYSLGFIPITCISVKIMVLNETGRQGIFHDCFRLRLGGYPDISKYNPNKCFVGEGVRASDAEELIKIIRKREK